MAGDLQTDIPLAQFGLRRLFLFTCAIALSATAARVELALGIALGLLVTAAFLASFGGGRHKLGLLLRSLVAGLVLSAAYLLPVALLSQLGDSTARDLVPILAAGAGFCLWFFAKYGPLELLLGAGLTLIAACTVIGIEFGNELTWIVMFIMLFACYVVLPFLGTIALGVVVQMISQHRAEQRALAHQVRAHFLSGNDKPKSNKAAISEATKCPASSSYRGKNSKNA